MRSAFDLAATLSSACTFMEPANNLAALAAAGRCVCVCVGVRICLRVCMCMCLCLCVDEALAYAQMCTIYMQYTALDKV